MTKVSDVILLPNGYVKFSGELCGVYVGNASGYVFKPLRPGPELYETTKARLRAKILERFINEASL